MMVSLIIIVISAVSLSRLPIDLMPDISYPALTVVVGYDGAGPEEIETLITRPIEEAMGSVSNVEEIESDSEEERSRVQLRFTWGTNLEEVTNDVRERLDRIRDFLPEEVDSPVLFKFDMSMMPILYFGLSGRLDPVDLRYLAEHTLKYRLERVPGVASLDISGGFRREIQVNLIRDKIVALNLSPRSVVQAIRLDNLDLPTGEVDEGDIELLVRTDGQFESLDELEQIVVATRNGVPVYLKDIAEVSDGFEELRQIERINGRPGITLSVTKQSGSNIIVTREPAAAVEGADAVYTDVWVSMGQESLAERKKSALKPYQVNAALMAKAKPDAVFMHCLPAHRDEEVTSEVLDGPQSIVFDQAENRLHVQKAIMSLLMR